MRLKSRGRGVAGGGERNEEGGDGRGRARWGWETWAISGGAPVSSAAGRWRRVVDAVIAATIMADARGEMGRRTRSTPILAIKGG